MEWTHSSPRPVIVDKTQMLQCVEYADWMGKMRK